ncbi:hypothetical protein PAXINDRAFT_84558 [Paxillus involutus ATCC 200175]|jgi:hypothetical protein|uniref:Reverse transcriptase zinc-binding domain-containing protein n=1 Tax=Paxillus involutus ATCC 200175 TaxID=664439 RepID=A0A0C9TL42_PAXIN|nr:hypothetical protein PAXINDRAFT_84558 [Paxillus involutus ATCC 200175]
MKHVALNTHLHHLTKSDTPHCLHCLGIKEDVDHFILACPQYAREHHMLRRKLRHQAFHLPYLLNEKAVTTLIDYVHSTGQLKSTFGEVPNLTL